MFIIVSFEYIIFVLYNAIERSIFTYLIQPSLYYFFTFNHKNFIKLKIHNPCIAVRYRRALKQTHKKLHKNRTGFLFPNIETKN